MNIIQPQWPVPSSIQAYSTLRFNDDLNNHFNLALHVNDNSENVKNNRTYLKQWLKLPSEPVWLQQTHSTIVLPALPENENKEADASYSQQANQVCVVLTADCLPILLCQRQGKEVAAIHAGWKGLAKGIIQQTCLTLSSPGSELLAWLGPAIGQKQYEVGEEVRQQFIELDANAEKAFTRAKENTWLANLYTLARLQLEQQGISAIYGGDYCTYSDPQKFFSYRREGVKTGRMATLIWISNNFTNL